MPFNTPWKHARLNLCHLVSELGNGRQYAFEVCVVNAANRKFV